MRSDSARYSWICVKLSTVARINQIIANTCCLTGYFKTEKQQEIKVFAAFDFQQYAKLCYIPENIFWITNSKLPEACISSVLQFRRFQPLWKKNVVKIKNIFMYEYFNVFELLKVPMHCLYYACFLYDLQFDCKTELPIFCICLYLYYVKFSVRFSLIISFTILISNNYNNWYNF